MSNYDYLLARAYRFRDELRKDIFERFPEIGFDRADMISMMATEKHIKGEDELLDYIEKRLRGEV